MPHLTEDAIEKTCLEWFESLGWDVRFGPDIAPDGPVPERRDYSQVILERRLEEALFRINPEIPPEAIEDAIREIVKVESPGIEENNRRFHHLLTDGVDVSFMRDGREVFDKVWPIDIRDIDNNDFLVVNQFTVIEHGKNRRPDVVVFVNGLPLAVIELKKPGDETATLKHAFNQLQTYKQDIPSLFHFNELLVISDGLFARSGTITSNWDRFMPWRTIDGTDLYREPGNEKQTEGKLQSGLETLVKGVFEKGRFLDLVSNFIVFEDDGARIFKKAAAYHQFHAVNKAIRCTLEATSEAGDRRIGVIWHTQGSGKSLLMVFFSGKLIKKPEMENPTLVVITDRNDLDGQLFSTFSSCRELLRQDPVQAESREHLKRLLQVPSGGVIFTTIQKFFPEKKGAKYPMLSDRKNIVVIADEAHRSQYDFIDGFARHMRDALPGASFIGFTGTPIEKEDRSTPAVFGDYIDKYDILRAVEDGATVPIYYESRLAKIELDENEKPRLDAEFEEITEEKDEAEKQRLKTRWAALEAMVGTPKRLELVAKDMVKHFEARLSAMDGKAMVVCMSRRICVELYDILKRLRPKWHSSQDEKGFMKVVMSGSASDPKEWQVHIRNKQGLEIIARRFKDPADKLKLVIVRDMWLTGFDCPPLHTMYIDKPMHGHGLMQAIARVNRVFRDKPGGLVVDYIGIAHQLKKALATYTEAGGRGKAAIDQEEAVNIMLEKYDVVVSMFHGFDYRAVLKASGDKRLKGLVDAMDFILSQQDGKKRFVKAVTALSKAFALAVPHEKALAIKDEVGFFQEVRAGLKKSGPGSQGPDPEQIDSAIRQLISKAIVPDRVVDIFSAAGLKKPDISILSEEFLNEVRQLPQRNLAVELLQRLIRDEIKTRARKNVVQSRAFS